MQEHVDVITLKATKCKKYFSPNTNTMPAMVKSRNVVTLSPMYFITSNPSFVLRIRMPNMNCRAKPQRTGRHVIYTKRQFC